MTWNGPDPELRQGTNRSHAKGPNAALRNGPAGSAKGPNQSLRRGPVQGMANGSVYKNGNKKGRGVAVLPPNHLISAQ